MIKIVTYFLFVFGIVFFAQEANAKQKEPKLRSSASTIELGDTVNLSWEIKRAKEVRLIGFDDPLPLNGYLTFSPTKDTIYQFVFTKWFNKEIVKKRHVKVVVPEIVKFNVPDSANDEDKIEIFWNATNANFVKISGIEDTLRPSGRATIQLDSSAILHMTAYGKFNRDKTSDTIEITQIEDFSCEHKVVYRGEPLPVSWKSKLSDGVYIHRQDSLLPPTGHKNLYPKKDTTYTVLIKRGYGVTDTLHQFSIKVEEPYISYFWGENSMLKGDKAILTWNVRGGEEIKIDGLGENLSRKGLITVSPEKSTTYTLRVKDGNKELTKTWDIKVYPFRKYISSTRHIDDVQPGEKLEMDIISADRTNYPNEIVLRVVAIDTLGNYISGITGPDSLNNTSSNYFKRINEVVNKKSYVRKFDVKEIQETASTPYDIAMVLDYSGSMSGTIGHVEKATEDFIRKKYLHDRISFTKFDSRLSTEAVLSQQVDSILDGISFNGLDGFGGMTALYAGADKGLKTIDTTDRHKVLILFTDGNENSSFMYFGNYAFTANQLVARLRKHNVKLFIISYGTGTNTDLLLRLASLGDGKIYFLYSHEDITGVFQELPRVLHQYYEIRYKPVDKAGDHKVFLTFNNLTQKNGTVDYEYHMGENYQLSNLEFDKDNYWYREIDGKKPVSPPQTAVNFIFNDDIIRAEYQLNLDKFLHYLESFPKAELDILAHADHVGTDEQCLVLTRRRAEKVKNYFLEHGIEENRLHVRPFGKSEPIWPHEDQSWQAAENRRVELILLE